MGILYIRDDNYFERHEDPFLQSLNRVFNDNAQQLIMSNFYDYAPWLRNFDESPSVFINFQGLRDGMAATRTIKELSANASIGAIFAINSNAAQRQLAQKHNILCTDNEDKVLDFIKTLNNPDID